MKRIPIFAALALTAGAAHADPVTVEAPKAPISAEAAGAYIARLDQAVKEVCQDAAGPIVGLAYYSYRTCIKATRAEVAKQDPTGLYAAHASAKDIVVAAR